MTRPDAKWRIDSRFAGAAALTSPLPEAFRDPIEVAAPRPMAGSLGRWFLDAIDVVSTLYDRARERRQLMHLDARLLRDMGLTRAQARSEAEKPFWRS